MSTLKLIAKQIVDRIENVHGKTPRKGKAFELEVFNLWIGAWCALKVTNHLDENHVGGYVSMVLASRGWSETRKLAECTPAKT
ncbi:hypothetical protein NKJ88_05880 [Mesorhizobium sp. M0016]|uniref:hypothetical protein n=1 Tax=Mesorhizobium sp. M0016 TaxID=2956843 RepID=UPI00333A02A0